MKHLLALILIILITNSAHAAKTNLNQITDLFDKNIQNKNVLLDDFAKQNDNAVNSIKSKEATNSLKGTAEADQNAIQLNSIKAVDLDNAGRDKRNSEEFKFYDENEFEPDYTKPGNRLHKLDANDINNATSKLMGNLMHLLNDLKLDCKTVKGPVEKEPTYHIDIKRDQQKNTEYDQLFCEEPRGKYTCSDELNIKCLRKGKKFLGNWQYKTIRIDGGYLHAYKSNWGYAIRRERKNWDWLVTPDHPRGVNLGGREKFYGDDKQVDSIWCENPQAIISDARLLIAQILGIYPEQIGEDVRFPPEGRGIGVQFGGVGRWRKVWPEYEFGYFIQDIADTCEVWGEDWNERCKLQ